MNLSSSYMRLTMLIVILITTLSGCKKDTTGMTVVKDCTGTYLRRDSKDYQVCNTEKTEAFANGATVEAAFEKTGSCPADTGVSCMMLHESAGWIKVTKIR